MGSALLSQWVNGPEAITVVDPAGSDVPDGVALVTDRSEIADDQFDCIIAAVKPQLIDDILADYVSNLAAGGYVLSIAAGYSAARLSKLMGDAPVIRTMPNLPAAIGRGVSGICPGPHASDDHLAHAQDFMSRAGSTVSIPVMKLFACSEMLLQYFLWNENLPALILAKSCAWFSS